MSLITNQGSNGACSVIESDFLTGFRGDPEAISALRNHIVLQGKTSERFKKFGRKRTGPKYHDPQNLEETGAISTYDAWLLYNIAFESGASSVFEFGTWFGTSACVISWGLSDAGTRHRISTCDRNYLHVIPPEKQEIGSIEFFHMESRRFLRQMRKLSRTAGFVFVDATLTYREIKLLARDFSCRVFVCHDRGTKKGDSCVSYASDCIKNPRVYVSDKSSLAVICGT